MPRGPYRAGYAIAVLSIIAGLAGILGEVPALSTLAQPVGGWPRLPLLAAIALVAIGTALWQFLEQHNRVAFSASAVAVAAVLASWMAEARGQSVATSAMSFATQVLVLTAASPLLILSARRRTIPEEVSLGIAGFVLLALATTLFISRATGVTDSTTDVLGAGPALQLLVISFLIGTCYVAMVWTRGLMSGESARWLPVAIALAGLVTVTVLWRGLASRERDQVAALTQQAAEGQRSNLRGAARVMGRSLRRAAQWHAAGATTDQQRRDGEALQRDLPGLEAFHWISAFGVPDTGVAPAPTSTELSVVSSYVNRPGGLADTISLPPARHGGRRVYRRGAGVRWRDVLRRRRRDCPKR